jgi:hypothetical protein
MKAIPGVNQLLFVTLTNAELAHYLPNIGALMESLDLSIVEEGGGGAVVIKKTGIGVGMVAGLFVFALIIAGGASGYFLMQKNNLEQEKANTERAIAALRPAEEAYNDYLKAVEYYDAFKGYIDGTVSDGEALLQMIVTLEEIMPQGVSVSNFQVTDSTVNMNVIGTKESLAKLLIELKKIPFIRDPWIDAINDSFDEFGTASTTGPLRLSINYQEARKYAEEHDSPVWQEDADFIGYVAPLEEGEEVTE